ncbi:Gfo/Idh/MocA family oxidoreductase [Candidatus Daviesbacteria bacterium]|nr:Gfo/Idh/MocA family oxidoreductase [Candidatus Daviesbacteria bacterium]
MKILALIGAGQWGRNYVNTIKSLPGCKLKYICATSIKTLNSFDSDYIKLTNYKSLFKYSDIDGVIIATPGSTHFKISSELLKNGFNLLVEKPLTVNYQEALKLKDIYDNLKKKPAVLVGYIDLYNPPFIKLQEYTNSIGEIRYISFEGLNNGVFRSDMSVIWEWGPHGVSMILKILKLKPEEVTAWAVSSLYPNSKLYDMAFIRLVFPNGTVAFIKVSWLSAVKKRELVVVGTKDTIIYNNLAEKKLTYFKDMGPEFLKGEFRQKEPKISYPAYSDDLPLGAEVLNFLQVIKGEKDQTDINQALLVSKILDLAQQSIIKKTPIRF